MRRHRLAPLVAACTLAACHPTSGPARPRAQPYRPAVGQIGATKIAFTLPRAGAAPTLGTLPFPSELWRSTNGYDLRGFPLATSPLVSRYVESASHEDGASISPTMFLRFVGPAPFSAIPPPDKTIDPASPVSLVDVDPTSPERGRRFPLEARPYPTETTYVPAGTLALKPIAGVMLRPSTTYALVVRRSLTSPPLGTTDEHEWIKWTEPRADLVEEAARRLHAPALDSLAQLGVARGDIASLAVFRTSRPDALGRAAVTAGAAATPKIVVATWEAGASLPGPEGYDVIKGLYCTPNYQRGIDDAPFTTRGGTVTVEGGALAPVALPPRWQTPDCGPMLRARFVLTVPRKRPGGNVPLVVSAHGTTGDAFSFVGARDFAGWAAAEGVAVVSTDQPLHGTPGDPGARPGRSAEVSLAIGPFRLPLADFPAPLMFYNPLRPEAAEGNMAQAIADAATLVKLFAGLDAANLTGLGARPDVPGFRLSTDRIGVAGHSQGSQSLAILGALDPRVSSVVLSGCGGDVRFGALHNKEIAKLRDLIVGYLGMAPGELDEFHPLLAAIGWVGMPADPEAYARFYREPSQSLAARGVLHIGGLGDRYNPEAASDALARALGATPLGPIARPIEWLAQPATRVAANAPGGGAIAYLQLAPTQGEDGHFVMYREQRAWTEVRRAFASLASGHRATFGM